MYKLRDYQNIQLDFLENHVPLSNVTCIQSGTGSGKSIVIMEFVRRYLEQNPLKNVIISTGFNNLVFDMETKSKEFNLQSIVLIGKKAINCPLKLHDYKYFTREDYTCGDEHKSFDNSTNDWNKKSCPLCTDKYLQLKNEILNARGKVIITNHSTLLVQQSLFKNIGIIIIDEAHTFGAFYDSFLELKLDKNDLRILDKCINKIKQPMSNIIKMNINNNVELPQKQIEKIVEMCKNDNERAEKFKEFFTTKRDYSNFVSIENDEYTLSKFYKYYNLDIEGKIILFSATLDKYTLSMFRASRSHVYIEYKMFCDYSKSTFLALPRDNFKNALISFLDYTHNLGYKIGCILSTTIFDMNIALSINGYNGYKMFTDKTKFEQYNGNKILVGSRGLFQGIDLPELQFVCLNKFPFPNYDDKNRALRNYLTDRETNGYDFWNDYTIPKCENDISQSLGRLWRKPDSFGVVSIFDERLEKFKYMIKHTMYNNRHGIKFLIMDQDNIINDWDVKN